MRRSKGETRFRRLLHQVEAVRDRLTDGQRRELAAIRRHIAIHNYWHYSQFVTSMHAKYCATTD